MVPPSSEQVPSKHKIKNSAEAQKSGAYYDEGNVKVNRTNQVETLKVNTYVILDK